MNRWPDHAVVYQIYVRSFADTDGDGVGDLRGVVSHLDHLDWLGVDALWLTPFYVSPLADGGYDVVDYRSVDPRLGCLTDMDRLVEEAHRRHLRVIIDVVPNHTSDQHPWFLEALASEPGSAERERYHFRPGRGADGTEPPNNWQSVFGGPAWTRLPDGDWYLHVFAPEQPDLNWTHPEVRAEFADVLRFWLDRGVDGVRVDVAHGLAKPAGLPDATYAGASGRRPYFDDDAVHDIYREWRKILDTYTPQRIAVAEARLRDVGRTARYVRPDELNQAFNFDFLWAPWDADRLREAIDRSISEMAAVEAVPTWVVGNHDEVRLATRLAGGPTGVGMADRPDTESGSALGEAADDSRGGTVGGIDGPDTGLCRARAMALLLLALPGCAYVYQGDELGLPEVLDLPDEVRADPIWHRSGGNRLGRDGCRVPIPWEDSIAPPHGFGPTGSSPWLPQPPSWAGLSVAAQRTDPHSTLTLYATALRLRRTSDDLRDAPLEWLDAPEGVLAFRRGGVVCVVNLGGRPVDLAGLGVVGPALVTSAPYADPQLLPADTAGWYAVPDSPCEETRR